MQPLISLITPTRNRADLLLRTIQNVQLQSEPNWEMLVIDDGDGSGMTAALGVADPRVQAFTNAGSGQVDARNTALKMARGEVIHLLDDDDRWLDKNHFSSVLQKLGSEKALLHRGGWLVLEQLENEVWLEQQRLVFSPATTPKSLRSDNTLLTSGVAYRKELHDELGLFDPELGNYWDWDWFLRVTSLYPLLSLEPPTVLMSWRSANVTSNTSRNPFETERLMYLERLSRKHNLGTIPPKNHFTVLEPTQP